MKTLNLSIFLFVVVFIIPSLGICQFDASEIKNQTGLSIHLKYGIPIPEHSEPTYNSFDTKFRQWPLFHTTIGAKYRYHFIKFLSVDFGMSYEYGNFSKVEKFSYTDFQGTFNESRIADRFATHSFIYPISINYHTKRFSFSTGLNTIFHLSTRVKVLRKSWDDGHLEFESTKVHKDGENYLTNPGGLTDHIYTNLDRKFNLQLAFAIQYRLTDKFQLDFELRKYLYDNQLVRNHWHYDAGDYFQYFNPYPDIFSVGLSYNLQKRSSNSKRQ